MKNKRMKILIILGILITFIFICREIFSNLFYSAAEEENFSDYIIFDLAAGNITINSTTYTGYTYEINENNEYTAVKKTGSHLETNRYYVMQSTDNNRNLVYIDSTIVLPTYTDIDENKFKNNTDVEQVIELWDNMVAEEQKTEYLRVPTNNNITITGSLTLDMTIDNIWSTYQVSTKGGINVTASAANTNVTLKLKGDNRLGNLFYYTGSTKTSSLTITSADTNDITKGSLTVIGNQDPTKSNSIYKSKDGQTGKVPQNSWNSVIGGSDSNDQVYNLKITGGTVYAGATKWEDCTAIGAGGNGHGNVIISGGIVTAVASTAGTAIGGGIGHSSNGGSSDVIINGGEVYAYNFGQPFSETVTANELKNLGGEVASFLPGTAIGGGSSAKSSGNKGVAKVTINDGYVYAESIGGSGIGAGNSILSFGGVAEVNINGGTVISKSIEGNGVETGTGIGGGSSINKNGGSATVTISGGNITANGIGGGNSNVTEGGDAVVTVNAGTIIAESIGGGFSKTKGYALGTVTVNGGNLNAVMAAVPKNNDNKRVFLTRVAVYHENEIYANKTINSIEISGNQNYGIKDMQTDEKGMLYLWLQDKTYISKGTIGNCIYYPEDEDDGKIDVKDIGVLKYNKETSYIEHFLVNTALTEYYKAYTSINPNNKFDGVAIVEDNTRFKYYIDIEKETNGEYYKVYPYIATIDSLGNQVFQRVSNMTHIENGMYMSEILINRDMQILYEVIGSDGTHFFTLDLTNGNVDISNDEYGLIIEQNGYMLNGYNGNIYITSNGYLTTNTITVNCESEDVAIYVDSINVNSDENAINLLSGTVHLTFNDVDNIIGATQESAINIDKNSTLKINIGDKDSLKLDGKEGQPAITGEGALYIIDNGGFLKLNNNDTSNIQAYVGHYYYQGNEPDQYNLVLNNGQFDFEVIGYTDKNNKMTNTTTHSEIFMAHGVNRVYNKVTDSGATINSNGDVVLVLKAEVGKIDEISILDENYSIMTLNTDYTYDESSNTITIYGKTFRNGSLFIMAATSGEIPYKSKDFDNVYDGNPHSIVVLVDNSKYNIYYGTTELEEEEFTEEAKILPTYTDATNGEKKVYWYITSKENTSMLISGFNTVNITKGVNKWRKRLSCTDVVLGTEPKPIAQAKWGDVKYTYYNADGTEIQQDKLTELDEGTYYVSAYVEENDNYDLLETGYKIKFRIFKTDIFTSKTRSLEKINGPDRTIEVPVNGEFSVYYKASSTEDMALRLDQKLPEGTKITMIVFPVEDTSIEYYYHIITLSDYEDGNTVIPIKSFYLMGSNEKQYQGVENNTQVEYQFTVDFTEEYSSSKNLQVSLDGMDNSVVNVIPLAKEVAYFNNTDLKLESSNGELRATVKPFAIGAGKKILAFEITDITETVAITLKTGETYMSPELIAGNLVIFNLGTGDVDNIEYTLIIENLEVKQYTIKSYVRIVGIDEDLMYALLGQNDSNSKSATITVEEYIKPILYVDIVDSERIISTSTEQLKFEVTVSDSIEKLSNIKTTLYIKQDKSYKYLEELEVSNIENNNVTVNLPTYLTEGTYRIVFEIGKGKCNYNIIVSE